jgi:uncharacterized protein (TIGR00255 family)
MINSMTGYGESQGELNGVSYAVELRSVNHRYLKAAVKLPESAGFLEEDIEKFLRRNLSRGAVNYVLRLKNVSANTLFDIDEAGLRAYLERLGGVASSAGINSMIDISGLLALPGMLTPISPDKKMAEQIKQTVLSISQEAMDKLKQMRVAEGKFLEEDLKKHCDVIKQDLEQIGARSAVVLAEYAKKLKRRVDELLGEAKLKLDEETLAREVAIFADRSDISEEMARLDSHLQQFAESCRSNTVAGRRLDFIAQEMLREANTIASKASDSEIVRCVVDIKCRVDRIKEQVQNIE